MNDLHNKLFSISSVFLPEDLARTLVESRKAQAPVQKIRVQRSNEPFIVIPKTHLKRLAELKSYGAFAIYGVLYLTWYNDPKKHNPVKLNMGELRKLGIPRRTVYYALGALRKEGLIQVAFKPGNSPTVFLCWKEKRERS
jgi:hypothetical protein